MNQMPRRGWAGIRHGGLALLVAVTLASCSEEANGATTGRLRGDEPAPEAGASPAFGHPVAIGALRLTISAPRPGPAVESLAPDEAGVVAVTVRSDNPTRRPQPNPEVAISCAGEHHAGWFTVSQWEPGESVKPGTYSEGELVLGLPIDCLDPVIRASNYESRAKDVVTWPLPAEAVRAAGGG